MTVSVSEWQDAVSRKPRGGPSGQHKHTHDGAGRAPPKSPSDRAGPRPGSTATVSAAAAAVGECPLCAQSFVDNDELNAHVDWCLSREAIRSAQVEGDGRERKKPEVSVRPPKEWWKGGSMEGTPRSRKPKRRKLGGC